MARLHIPVTTNPDVEFKVNGRPVTMTPGQTWYLRLADPHSVANRGTTERTHIVLDVVANAWLLDRMDAALATPRLAPAAWQSKVSPAVLAAAANGPTETIVFLSEQADLSAAASLPTKLEKGRYVYEQLTRTAARAQKPVVAIANSLAASAAYWIGCSASEFYVTPGGEVGSIGVWQAHQDYSKAMDEAGVKTTLISAGKFKVEGNPYAPLDEEAQGFMQSRVDDYYAAFTKAVAKGRGVPISQVRDGMGQGRVLGADAALASSMVDGIATFDDVVKKMRRDARAQIKPNASRLNQARNSLALM